MQKRYDCFCLKERACCFIERKGILLFVHGGLILIMFWRVVISYDTKGGLLSLSCFVFFLETNYVPLEATKGSRGGLYLPVKENFYLLLSFDNCQRESSNGISKRISLNVQKKLFIKNFFYTFTGLSKIQIFYS